MHNRWLLMAVLGAGVVAALRGPASGGSGKRASTLNTHPRGVKLETATFGGGCFWHVEDDFRQVEGVITTTVGFEGGSRPAPSYEEVCTNLTGHAEVVRIRFDPTRISYKELLEVFFRIHDPTTLDRQGRDVGKQYRSVIFYHSPEQKAAAEEYKAGLEKSGRFKRPVVTEIAPASTFWKAEEYHQQYYEKQRS